MGDNLKERTAKGLFWGVVNNGTTQVLNILIGIFLGRLLSPEDYGIVGVLTIFTVIAGNLQSSGFTQGLVNLKKPTARDYNSVFWFNVLASVTIYIIPFLSAPLIARFFHEPRLVAVSRFVFLGFFISSFGIA
ncbi:MAG: oligosaccharide flippase family protein, partial [Prevotella sp.]|nr:oligosaccharide flippase family protein [Prevotella sp.]